jgi:hypothetical protein
MHYAGDRAMKRVAVIHQDGRVLWTYKINLPGFNYEPSDDEYFEQARKNAIEDKLVDGNEAKQLSFRFVR